MTEAAGEETLGTDSVVRSPLPPDEVLVRLGTAAKRGRLAGFRELPGGGTFEVEAYAHPFTHALVGSVSAGPEGGARVRFRLRRPWPMPAFFAAVLVFVAWPGVVLTDSLLATYWAAYGGWTTARPWLTYAWYLPLAVLPLPWVWRECVRRSAAMAHESAREAIGKIARETDGGVEGG